MADVRAAGGAAAPRATYHHGDLRRTLIRAAVELAEEIGPEQVTMREAARRAGVSSGAPFRHFPTKAALMTAVAEEAIDRMRAAVDAALAEAAADDPLVRYSAFARGYIDFVVADPTWFRILSDRRILDWSPHLQRQTAGLQAQMRDLLTQAADAGLLRAHADIRAILLDSRAISYGAVRTYVDGQMPTWGVPDDTAPAAMRGVMRRFAESLAADPARHAWRL